MPANIAKRADGFARFGVCRVLEGEAVEVVYPAFPNVLKSFDFLDAQ